MQTPKWKTSEKSFRNILLLCSLRLWSSWYHSHTRRWFKPSDGDKQSFL